VGSALPAVADRSGARWLGVRPAAGRSGWADAVGAPVRVRQPGGCRTWGWPSAT